MERTTTTTSVSVQLLQTGPIGAPNATMELHSGDLAPAINGDAAGGPSDFDNAQSYVFAFKGQPNVNGKFPIIFTFTLQEGAETIVRTAVIEVNWPPYAWSVGPDSSGPCATSAKHQFTADFANYPRLPGTKCQRDLSKSSDGQSEPMGLLEHEGSDDNTGKHGEVSHRGQGGHTEQHRTVVQRDDYLYVQFASWLLSTFPTHLVFGLGRSETPHLLGYRLFT